MALFAWIMMGLALWHFTIFLPDHFWGGIVGAFLGALLGGVVSGLVINAGGVPGNDDTSFLLALEALPGAVLGMVFVYYEGLRRERGAA